jgi:hypothetical protein
MPVLLPATAVYLPPAAAPIPNYTAGLAQGSNAPFEVDYSLCDSSAYLEDVNIPDGTIFAPGEVFVKTWLLRNTGFCTWKDDYALTLFEGNSMSGQDTKIEKKNSGRQRYKSFDHIDGAKRSGNLHRLLDFEK